MFPEDSINYRTTTVNNSLNGTRATVIHVNPLFGQHNTNATPSITMNTGAHINPLFIQKLQNCTDVKQNFPKIYMNPNFLKLQYQMIPTSNDQLANLGSGGSVDNYPITPLVETTPSSLDVSSTLPASTPTFTPSPRKISKSLHENGKIITKTKNRIVREPLKMKTPKIEKNVPEPYIRISSKKLIRRSIANISPVELQKSNGYTKKSPTYNEFKISLNENNESKQKDSSTPLRLEDGKYILKSRGYKLIRLPSSSSSSTLSSATSSLTPFTSKAKRIHSLHKWNRYKYFASKATTKNKTYINTSFSSNTLMAAARVKQRSVKYFTRKFAKSNMPCVIYQRLGKCIALEKGKCLKVHDKEKVALCPKFLRGECHQDDCLLSHNISLSKMPVCKFYLQRICVRDNCPYLHKKLSSDAKICEDFLQGYCPAAEKCDRLHVFRCLEFQKTKVCTKENCKPCKRFKRKNSSNYSSGDGTKQFPKNKIAKYEHKFAILSDENNRNNDMDIVANGSTNVPNSIRKTNLRYTEKLKKKRIRYFITNPTTEQIDTTNPPLTDTIHKSSNLLDIDESKTLSINDNNNRIVDVDDNGEEEEEEEEEELNTKKTMLNVLSRRPKVGCLPAYIPLPS